MVIADPADGVGFAGLRLDRAALVQGPVLGVVDPVDGLGARTEIVEMSPSCRR
jgi:hypothetical protein